VICSFFLELVNRAAEVQAIVGELEGALNIRELLIKAYGVECLEQVHDRAGGLNES